MKNKIAALIVIFGGALGMYFLWTARLAKKKTDNVLEQFKKIDSSLIKTNDSLKNGMNALDIDRKKINYNYLIATTTSHLGMYIDSLMEKTDLNPTAVSHSISISKKEIARLKNELRNFNLMMTDNGATVTADTFDIANIRSGNKMEDWETVHFTNASKEQTYTYLIFIKNLLTKYSNIKLQGD